MREWGRPLWAWQHEAEARGAAGTALLQPDFGTRGRHCLRWEKGSWQSTSTGFPCVTVAAGNTFLHGT